MRRALFCLAGMMLLSGCSSGTPAPGPRTAEEEKLFGPVKMQLDSFSKMESWTKSGTPDGVEALLEFDDQFGDHTKAAGNVVFELFEYRKGWADPRGPRVVNPWVTSLETYAEQKAHWERASGAYTFQLKCPGLKMDHNYVLTAMFETTSGQRFFSKIIIVQLVPEETKHSRHVPPTSQPESGSGPRIPAP
jgi:hypothetical protein